MCLCKKFDPDYAEGNSRWEVTLSNGEIIYSDNGTPNAWIRLGDYCTKHNLYITNMSFGFRTNMINLPSNADGYYFSRGVRGLLGADRTLQLFNVGTLQNNKLIVTTYKVPEMLSDIVEERNIKGAGPCLIRKNISPYMVP